MRSTTIPLTIAFMLMVAPGALAGPGDPLKGINTGLTAGGSHVGVGVSCDGPPIECDRTVEAQIETPDPTQGLTVSARATDTTNPGDSSHDRDTRLGVEVPDEEGVCLVDAGATDEGGAILAPPLVGAGGPPGAAAGTDVLSDTCVHNSGADHTDIVSAVVVLDDIDGDAEPERTTVECLVTTQPPTPVFCSALLP